MDLAAGSHLHLLDLKSRGVSHHTLRAYTLVESRYLEWLRAGERGAFLHNLEIGAVREFLVWLADQVEVYKGREKGHGPSSLWQHVKILKAWSAYLTGQEHLYRDDPLKALRYPRLPERVPPRLQPADVKRMIDLCATTAHPLRNAAILWLLYDTGLRVSELCAVRLQDLSPATTREDGFVRVERGKGGKGRVAPFGTKCSKAIQRYLISERGEWREPWLFLTPRGRQLTRSSVDYVVRTQARRAGIVGVRTSSHVFRHTFASEFLRQNPGQLVQLQAILGHADLTMVQHYARLNDSDIRESYRSPGDRL